LNEGKLTMVNRRSPQEKTNYARSYPRTVQLHVFLRANIIEQLTRALIFTACLCLNTAVACAINWEGHDDWLADTPMALELERHFDGSATPSPSPRRKKDCQPLNSVGTISPNPYEPVPPLCREGGEFRNQDPKRQ
jgi:hypothetical protein